MASRLRVETRRGLANLIAAIDFNFDVCKTDRPMMHALHTVLAGAVHKPALVEAVAKLNRDSVHSIEAAIRAEIANGEIRRGIDARAWAVQILSTVRGIVAQWLVDPEGMSTWPRCVPPSSPRPGAASLQEK